MSGSDMLTSTQVAQKLGVSITTVKNYEVRGLLKPDKVLPTGRRYYDSEKVDNFYKSMMK